MGRKPRLIELNANAFAEEQTFIAGLSGEERSEAGSLQRWCAKDVIAHNASWKNRMAENLIAAAQGKPTHAGEDYNRDNVEFFELHCQKTWEEVLVIAEQAYRALQEQVGELNEAGLEDTNLLPWQEDRPLWRLAIVNGYTHPVTHIAEYHRDRDRTKIHAQLIAEMVRQCQAFDDSPTWQGVVQYNLACQYALLGQPEPAIHALRQAFSLYPALIEISKGDTDLDLLRCESEYRMLLSEV